jgi:hypothetical protein
MIPQEVYGVMFFIVAVIIFSLGCWCLCWWVDKEKDFVARKCRQKNRQYARQERAYKRHLKARKDLGKLL